MTVPMDWRVRTWLIYFMKLYKVKVEYETVILATSPDGATREAEHAMRHEIGYPPQSIGASEIKSFSDLPKGWQPNYRPWGERDPHDRTIEGILKSSAEVSHDR